MSVLQSRSAGQEALTITKTKTKKKTFKQICKEWSTVLKRNPHIVGCGTKLETKNPLYLNLKSARFCIVGEAHGFNNEYFDQREPGYCPDCKDYANDFYYQGARDYLIGQFVSHWNDVHTSTK